MPLALAPIGMAGMMAPREVQAARAAPRPACLQSLFTVGICPPKR
jgi:isopentenyl diphosphate isomerase/L-lactate dehydrogenase-like FMN-dependent dehydrogenase